MHYLFIHNIIELHWLLLAQKPDSKVHLDMSDDLDDTSEEFAGHFHYDKDAKMYEDSSSDLDEDPVEEWSDEPDINEHVRLQKDLSDGSHYDESNDEHNVKYDHEAFLGKEEAEHFDKLPPHEAKEKLRSDI